MALTKIVKGMLADGSVQPSNLITTGSYTVGTLNLNTLTVSGANGLTLNNIRSSTGTQVAFYNTSTSEVTYGPLSAALMGFDQSLNTTDSVTFANTTITNTLRFSAGQVKIAGMRASTFTLPGQNAILLAYNTSTNEVAYITGPNQALSTSSNVTFARVTATNIDVSSTLTVGVFGGSRGRIEIRGNDRFGPIIGEVTQADITSIENQSSGYGGEIALARLRTQDIHFIESGNAFGNVILAGGNRQLAFVSTLTGTFFPTTTPGTGYINIFAGRILPGNVSGGTTVNQGMNVDIGAPGNRFNRIYARSVFVSTSTIYFEDYDEGTYQTSNTSTFSLAQGTVSIDGTPVLDQSVLAGSDPTFGTITAQNATITNLTVIGTMTTLNVTTENVTTENIVTQNFADGTSQTTAWTGTVANSQITSVSTSKVNGLSVVGWTNNYNDLINKPTIPSPFDLSTVTNQALFTTSTVTFQHVRTANTLTFAGAVARMAGVRLASFVTPGASSNILFYNTTTGETGWFPGPNQAVSTSSVVTFTGVTTTNITVNGNVVFADATTQNTTGLTSVYARNALPTGRTGRIITISDSGSDTNSPAGNFAPAYWDPDANVWTYIGNSNSVTPI